MTITLHMVSMYEQAYVYKELAASSCTLQCCLLKVAGLIAFI